jgi:putative autoinducer-2 (AI-2) aldolase
MADMDDLKESKQYYFDTPQKTEGFFLKGSNSLDWGMKNRLARIFSLHRRIERRRKWPTWTS